MPALEVSPQALDVSRASDLSRRTCSPPARTNARRCTHAGNVDACVPTRTSLGPSCRGRRWTCRGRRWRGPACRRRVLARTSPGRACPRWVHARLAAPRRRRERRLCARADTLVRATLRSLRLAKVVAPYRAWPSARRQGGCGTRTPTPSSGRCQVAARLRPLRLSKVAAPHPSSAFGRSGRHPVAALRPLRLSKVAAPHPSCAGRRKGAARAPQGRRKGAARAPQGRRKGAARARPSRRAPPTSRALARWRLELAPPGSCGSRARPPRTRRQAPRHSRAAALSSHRQGAAPLRRVRLARAAKYPRHSRAAALSSHRRGAAALGRRRLARAAKYPRHSRAAGSSARR